MLAPTSPPPSSFENAASHYPRNAGAQVRAAAQLARLLAELPAPIRVWEIGCGTGFLTRQLAALWPYADIIAQDASPAMLMEAASLPAHSVRWWGADARTQSPSGDFDLVTSSSALHWLGTPARILPHILGPLRKRGFFAASIMVSGTLGEARRALRQAVPRSEFPDLPDTGDWLAALPSGMRLLRARTTEFVELHDGPRAVVHALRGQGVNGHPFKPQQPLSVPETRAMLENWSLERRTDGRWPVTYRVLELLAERL